jgi:hypothetical protein
VAARRYAGARRWLVVGSGGRGRAGPGGPRLAGGRRRRLGGAAHLHGLLCDSPPGRPLSALFGVPIGLRLSLLGADQPLHAFQLPGGLRAGEEATEGRMLDAVVGGEVAQRLAAGAAAKQRLVGYQPAQFGRHSPILGTHQERTRNAPATHRAGWPDGPKRSAAGDLSSRPDHPSGTRKKRLPKPFTSHSRCLYEQQGERRGTWVGCGPGNRPSVPWRCTVHFLREALGHARREQQPMLAALIRPIFNADSGAQARGLLGEAIQSVSR